MDYKEIATQIVDLSGGTENIKSVTHCATRLRLIIKDEKKVDFEALKKVELVLGALYAGGQEQVILGKNLVPVYNAVVKGYNFEEDAVVNENLDEPKEKLTFKSGFKALVGYIASSVSPQTPGLIAGGMLKVILLLVSLAVPSAVDGQTYKLFSMVADVPFYFMPIFIAYGASRKLGSTPIYSMIVAAALISPSFVALIGSGESWALFGALPVRLVRYSSTLFPALLCSLLACYVEKFLNKYVPSVLRTILVGLGTISISYAIGIVVLAPLGSYIGIYLARFFVWLGTYVAPITVMLLAAVLPYLVMTGTHTAIAPLMTQSIADPGYDKLFRPAFIMHNMAEGGACIGVGLRTKNADFRAECFSMAFSCIVAGVTEPAIYGINLRLKKPMIAVSIGGAAGGLVAAILGATAYQVGYSTVLAVPIFQDTIVAILAGIAVAIVVAAIAAFILGFEEGADKKIG